MTPEEIIISPTKFNLSALFFSRETFHDLDSLLSFSISDFALLHFLSESV